MAEIARLRVVAGTESGAGLNGGNGGGTFDGMEERVAKLEDKVDKLSESVGNVRERLVAVETKIDALPTKDWITTRLQAYLGIMVAVSAIAIGITKLI